MIQPFPDPLSAWLWTCAVLRAREAGQAGPPGPCTIEVVLRPLDRLYRLRRLDLLHVRTLRRWGWRGHAPTQAPRDGMDLAIWTEAIDRLTWPWQEAGVVSRLARSPSDAAPCPPPSLHIAHPAVAYTGRAWPDAPSMARPSALPAGPAPRTASAGAGRSGNRSPNTAGST